jgi:Mrp family chromosome partitioning ATPase
MTTFDRAFIKAFEDNVPPQSAARRDAPQAPRPPRTAAPPPLVNRSPLQNFEVCGESPAGEFDMTLPLSSFAARPKIHDSCRALLEIDRAAWPQAANDLLGCAPGQWDQFVEHIIQRTSQGHKTIAIASADRGDGRTTVALALAKHAAGRGLRLVAVDVDLENPALARACGVNAHTGWDDLVSSELPLGEALISVVEDGVTLLPWRGRATPLAELAGSLRTGVIFGTLREHYDLVVLDTMPLVGRTTIADFAALAAAIRLDSVYLVQNVRTTPRDELVATSAKLRRSGLPLAGVIENFVSSTGATTGHRSPAAGRHLAVHG